MASFRKRPNGWEYRISYKDENGKNKIKSKGGFKTKSEASKVAAEMEVKISKAPLSDKSILLYDFFKDWATIHKKPYISEVTWKKYEQTLRHINLYMKNKRVADMTPTYYQEILNRFGKKYAQETMDNFHFHIKSAMRIAVHERIIDENFAEFVVSKSQVAPRPMDEKFLEEDEYLDLIKITEENTKYKSYFTCYLIAVTGLRFAEALGLTWSDVDWDNGLLNINKTWNYSITNDWAETKSEASKRNVPISKKTLDIIAEYKDKYWVDNEFDRIIFGVSHAACNKTLKKLVGRNIHLHSLRHTYASFLISKDVDLISISHLLGHENLNITLAVYAHQLEALETKNHEVVQKIFNDF